MSVFAEAEIEWRTCPKCSETKPSGHFNKHKRQCKECRAAVQRDYVERNRDVVNERSRSWQERTGHSRRRHLSELYGISPEQYDSLLASQGNLCGICRGETIGRDGRLGAVDHSHVTNEIRGVLCTRCNVGIAQFRDNPDFLRAALAYLARFQEH